MPEVTITLPTLHAGQVAAWRPKARRKALRCGRRWGKTKFLTTLAADAAIRGWEVGIFAPDYKVTSEFWMELSEILAPIKRQASFNQGVFRCTTGGRVDVWSLENDRAGRSRKYRRVLIDEAAFTKDNMMTIWERSIEPTLLDYGGEAIVASTPNGIRDENFFWQICNQEKHGFTSFVAPTSSNPLMPAAEIEQFRLKSHPLVFRQEFLAEFIDWSGQSFFAADKWLINEKPIDYPVRCDAVFCVLDTATKDGIKNDGTAVTFFAIDKLGKHPLIILDWDIVQIEGALLENWLPSIFVRLEEFSKRCGARKGSLGAFIEDKSSGMVLLQHARRKRWPAQAVASELTSVGKDARALSVSGYHYNGHIKMVADAYHKTTKYKETVRNHFISQLCGYHVGVQNQADDLLDTYTYGISLALGNYKGF